LWAGRFYQKAFDSCDASIIHISKDWGLLEQANFADPVQEQSECIAAVQQMQEFLPIKPKHLQVAKPPHRGSPLHLFHNAYLSKELALFQDGKGFVIPALASL
jgi:hypothetical protein